MGWGGFGTVAGWGFSLSHVLSNHTKFAFHPTIYHACICITYKIYAGHNIFKMFYHWVKLTLPEYILSSDEVSKATSISLPAYKCVPQF